MHRWRSGDVNSDFLIPCSIQRVLFLCATRVGRLGQKAGFDIPQTLAVVGDKAILQCVKNGQEKAPARNIVD
jgi:hypothetical protein